MSYQRHFTLLIIAAAICCCGTPAQVPAASTQPPGSRAAANTSPRANRYEGAVKQTIREIATLRGWAPNLDVGVKIAEGDEIMSALLREMRAQMEPRVEKAQSDFLVAFGLVPPDFEFGRDVLRRFAGDVSGLYCISCRQILVAASVDSQEAKRTLRHEVVHAFQDSRYALGRKAHWQTDRGDYIAALHALAEGEATCIALALEDPRHLGCLDESMPVPSGDFLSGVPRFIRSLLAAPYVEGSRYVGRLLRKGGWAAVEHAWVGELRSTRQLARDVASKPARLPSLALPPELGRCELPYVDTVGEQQLRYLVSEEAATLESTLASVDADRMAVWRCSGLTIAVLRVLFRSETAAETFAVLLAGSLGFSDSGHGPSCFASRNRAIDIHRRGRDIAIASVLEDHGHAGPPARDTCPLARTIARHLTDLSTDL